VRGQAKIVVEVAVSQSRNNKGMRHLPSGLDSLALRGPRLKLDRAESHIEDFHEVLRVLLDNHRETVTVESDASSGEMQCVMVEPLLLPDELALIAGDAAHNLRSAWDHLAVLLIERTNQNLRTQFPLGKNVDAFEEQLTKYGFRGCSADVIKAIRDLKPYRSNGGNAAFCDLHALDILDKHRLVIAVGEPEVHVPMLAAPDGKLWTGTVRLQWDNGRCVGLTPPNARVNIGDKLTPALGVVFGSRMPSAGKAIYKTLNDLLIFSRDEIANFSRFL
jgi:hypothetical protein